jgi:predicted DNA-binding transcriptional regulator YafY
VGFDLEKNDIRGFLLSRIIQVPNASVTTHDVGTEVVQRARDWSPREFEEGSSVDVTVSTDYALREAQLHPRTSEVGPSSKEGCSELRLSFDTESVAMAWLAMNERNVVSANGKFKSAAKNWLKGTNQPTTTSPRGHTFSDAFDPWASDEAMNLALRMAAAVIAAGELSATKLAEMFSVDVDHVRTVFHELVMARSPKDDTRYFLPITLSDELNEEGDYDYIVDGNATTMFGGTDPLAWTEVFAVSLMLEQIQRLASGTPVAATAESLAAKIHSATDVSLSVLVSEVPFASEIAQSVGASQLRIKYQSASQEEPTWRLIAPVEEQFVCGEAYLRAYEVESGTYKTYALNRIWDVQEAGQFPSSLPADVESDWLATLLKGSTEVLIETNEAGLPLFENLPEVQVAKEPSSFGFVLKVKVANQDFLDRRLAAAGKNARVIGDGTPRAGTAFATELANRL